MGLRYGLLIPALDESQTLPLLFEELRRAGNPEPVAVVVVDNGSSDDTARVAVRLGAHACEEPRPGYGRACLRGIAHYREIGPPDVLVFLDADDFAAPRRLSRLLAPIESGKADMVIGERVSRSDDRGVRWHARLGNRLVLGILRLRYGSDVRDMGPFRAIRWSALEHLRMDDGDYGWYVQMQVRALRAGQRVLGTEVEFERRTVGQSKVSGSPVASVRAGWGMLRTLAVEMLRTNPPYQPWADNSN